MGWWTQNEEGVSFANARGEEMIWGDGPADIIADAVQEIIGEFNDSWGRNPTKAEITAGLMFHLAPLDNELREPSEPLHELKIPDTFGPED